MLMMEASHYMLTLIEAFRADTASKAWRQEASA